MFPKINFYVLFILLFLLISIVIFCNIKFKVDQFTDMSCYAQQNKYYQPEELMFKSQCPNLVVLKKYKNGFPLFFVEEGDENGPYFSKDYSNYYYLGISPDGERLDLEYELYYYPRYNPMRWFYGPYRYHRPDRWFRKNKFRKINKLKRLNRLNKFNKLDNLNKNRRYFDNKSDIIDKSNKSNILNKQNVINKNNKVKSLLQQKQSNLFGSSSRL